MADENEGKVRYQVTGPVFVNGSYVEAKERDQKFIFAAPGLEGPNLKLAPEPTAAPQDGAGDKGEKLDAGGKAAKGEKTGAGAAK